MLCDWDILIKRFRSFVEKKLKILELGLMITFFYLIIFEVLFCNKMKSMGFDFVILLYNIINSKKIVNLYFERIVVTSEGNKGIEFSTNIPVKKKQIVN
jgi:hypothetical protein